MNNIFIITQTAGGLGLFLLGMIVMTEGLRALAGSVIRKSLIKYTHTPLSGAVTGALCTAVLQSSSAVTVAAVGFVGAELMPFINALGIIFGANIGTTITGWLVALVGFKLKLGLLTLPLIFLGALLRLFSKSKIAHIGFALAGFGLIFVGISTIQSGMSGLQSLFDFSNLPTSTFAGRMQLVAFGIIFTFVTQSSSAGVAATLTAINSELLDLEQGITLVIGMDIGTTITAAFATIGAPIDARRTGFSHVLFNIFSGLFALFLINPYLDLSSLFFSPSDIQYNVFMLVVFHTAFNFLAVCIAVPLTPKFALMVERLIPDNNELSFRLDKRLLQHPELALNSLYKCLVDETLNLLNKINGLLTIEHETPDDILQNSQNILNQAQEFLEEIHLNQNDQTEWLRLVALLHTQDHLQRLLERCIEEQDRAATARENKEFFEIRSFLVNFNQQLVQLIQAKNWENALTLANETQQHIEQKQRDIRNQVIVQVASGKMSITNGTKLFESIRWIKRVSKHITRIVHYLHQSSTAPIFH